MFCREDCTQIQEELEEKTKTVDVLIAENQEIRSQLEEMTNRVQKSESENKMLIDRWMLQKMQDAERLNEVHRDFLFMRVSNGRVYSSPFFDLGRVALILFPT